MPTGRLWAFLQMMADGAVSAARAAQETLAAFSVRSARRWHHRFLRGQDRIRCWLVDHHAAPPPGAESGQLADLLAGLQAAFPGATDPLAALQLAGGPGPFPAANREGRAM